MTVGAASPRPSLLVLAADDDVAVCLRVVTAGEAVPLPDGSTVVALDDIAAGHKIALRDLPLGAVVHKYGQPIGVTSAAVRRGAHVHVHNLGSGRAGGSH